MDTPMNPPVFDDVRGAARRIAPWIHQTPVLTSETFDAMTGARLFFKCENLQKAGAFKARGATNAVFSLSDEQAAKGVATHSSGNHAQALARAAACRGIDCTVVMPYNAPQPKVDAVRGYGAEVVRCEATLAAREAALDTVVAETGATFVHPYNDPRVIAGQGTCAVELLETAGPLDSLIAPIGGGGLISGSTITCSALAPATDVIAAEPAAADDAYRSFHAGHIVEDGHAPDTVADGLRVFLRPLTWHFVSNHVADVLLADEAEIIEAMRLIWQRMKIIVEPSCAVTLAVVLKNRERFAGQRIGLILTGGNVDLDTLPWQR